MLMFLICIGLLFLGFPNKNKKLTKSESHELMKMMNAESDDISKESEKNKKQEQNDNVKSFKMLSPIYSLIFSNSYEECSKKLANLIIYITTISMFLACLYSSPDYDVLFLIWVK